MTTTSDTPVDGGKPYRWGQPDGSTGFDLPELTRRVRNAWEGTGELDPAEGDDVPEPIEVSTRTLLAGEWEAVCTLLELLPAVYQQRDQARRMAMALKEQLAQLQRGCGADG